MANFGYLLWSRIYLLKKKTFIYPPRDTVSLRKSTTSKEVTVAVPIAAIAPTILIQEGPFNFGTVFVFNYIKIMMKNICLLMLLLTFLGCSSISVFTDHDSGVDFSKYKTFAYFKPGIDKVEISDLDKRRILKAIDQQMEGKSMMKSDMPDLLVSINTTAKEKVYVNQMNYGFWGWGWNPWMWGPNSNTVSNRTEGALYIDLIDAKTKQLVWQGKGRGGISEYTKDRDERIGIFVEEILKNYPPESAL